MLGAEMALADKPLQDMKLEAFGKADLRPEAWIQKHPPHDKTPKQIQISQSSVVPKPHDLPWQSKDGWPVSALLKVAFDRAQAAGNAYSNKARCM